MLTQKQVDYFRTFGLLVLRGHLDAEVTEALSAEVDFVLRDALGARFDERDEEDGITGHYVPVTSQRAPLSRSLIEDERFQGIAEELLEGQALPWCPEAQAILFFGEAAVHADVATGVKGVKFAAYLEALTAKSGALRLLAGSHHADFGSAAWTFERSHPVQDAEGLRRHVEALPLFAAETNPGDVIVFHLHTYHASVYGKDRRQWTVTYLKDPVTADERAAFDRHVQAEHEWVASHGGDAAYDRSAYPFFDPEWVAADDASSVRARVVTRMRKLGVFDVPWE